MNTNEIAGTNHEEKLSEYEVDQDYKKEVVLGIQAKRDLQSNEIGLLLRKGEITEKDARELQKEVQDKAKEFIRQVKDLFDPAIDGMAKLRKQVKSGSLSQTEAEAAAEEIQSEIDALIDSINGFNVLGLETGDDLAEEDTSKSAEQEPVNIDDDKDAVPNTEPQKEGSDQESNIKAASEAALNVETQEISPEEEIDILRSTAKEVRLGDMSKEELEDNLAFILELMNSGDLSREGGIELRKPFRNQLSKLAQRKKAPVKKETGNNNNNNRKENPIDIETDTDAATEDEGQENNEKYERMYNAIKNSAEGSKSPITADAETSIEQNSAEKDSSEAGQQSPVKEQESGFENNPEQPPKNGRDISGGEAENEAESNSESEDNKVEGDAEANSQLSESESTESQSAKNTYGPEQTEFDPNHFQDVSTDVDSKPIANPYGPGKTEFEPNYTQNININSVSETEDFSEPVTKAENVNNPDKSKNPENPGNEIAYDKKHNIELKREFEDREDDYNNALKADYGSRGGLRKFFGLDRKGDSDEVKAADKARMEASKAYYKYMQESGRYEKINQRINRDTSAGAKAKKESETVREYAEENSLEIKDLLTLDSWEDIKSVAEEKSLNPFTLENIIKIAKKFDSREDERDVYLTGVVNRHMVRSAENRLEIQSKEMTSSLADLKNSLVKLARENPKTAVALGGLLGTGLVASGILSVPTMVLGGAAGYFSRAASKKVGEKVYVNRKSEKATGAINEAGASLRDNGEVDFEALADNVYDTAKAKKDAEINNDRVATAVGVGGAVATGMTANAAGVDAIVEKGIDVAKESTDGVVDKGIDFIKGLFGSSDVPPNNLPTGSTPGTIDASLDSSIDKSVEPTVAEAAANVEQPQSIDGQTGAEPEVVTPEIEVDLESDLEAGDSLNPSESPQPKAGLDLTPDSEGSVESGQISASDSIQETPGSQVEDKDIAGPNVDRIEEPLSSKDSFDSVDKETLSDSYDSDTEDNFSKEVEVEAEAGAKDNASTFETSATAENIEGRRDFNTEEYKIDKNQQLGDIVLEKLSELRNAGQFNLPENYNEEGNLGGYMWQKFSQIRPDQWIELGVSSGDPSQIFYEANSLSDTGDIINGRALMDILNGESADKVLKDLSIAEVDASATTPPVESTDGVADTAAAQESKVDSNVKEGVEVRDTTAEPSVPINADAGEGGLTNDAEASIEGTQGGPADIAAPPPSVEDSSQGAAIDAEGNPEVAFTPVESVKMSEEVKNLVSKEFVGPTETKSEIIYQLNKGLQMSTITLPTDMTIEGVDYKNDLKAFIEKRLPELAPNKFPLADPVLSTAEWAKLGVPGGDPANNPLTINDTLKTGKLLQFIFSDNLDKTILFPKS